MWSTVMNDIAQIFINTYVILVFRLLLWKLISDKSIKVVKVSIAQYY